MKNKKTTHNSNEPRGPKPSDYTSNDFHVDKEDIKEVFDAEEFLKNICQDKGQEALTLLDRLLDSFETGEEDIECILDDVYALLGRVPSHERKNKG